MFMKKTSFVILILLTVFLLASCGKSEPEPITITVPALVGTDIDSAKSILTSKGLIPIIKNEENSEYNEGIVFNVDPAVGSSVEPDSTVTLYVSIGVTEKLKVGKVDGLDEETAKQMIMSQGLIPVVSYEYDDIVNEGFAIKTSPSSGSAVEEGEQVEIIVSKGPRVRISASSYMNWKYVGDGHDCWEFYSPRIEDNTLIIECHNVTLYKTFEWQDTYNNGWGNGEACLNDTFDKTVPIQVCYSDKNVQYNEPFSVTIKIPLSELNTDRPTDLYMQLYYMVGESRYSIKLDVSMTW